MKILMLSYAFPPVAAAESFVAAKEMSHLKKENIEIDVIALEGEKAGLTVDHSLDEYIQTNYHHIWRVQIKTYMFKLSKWFPRLTGILMQFPDKYIFANRNVLNILNHIDINQYDLIITRSQWHSIHLVGVKLKEKYPHIPWIAHFSDPWVDNILAIKLPMVNAFLKKWEKKVIEKADKITFTTPETIDLVFRKYSEEFKQKAIYMPHCFDKSLYSHYIEKSKDRYLIRCLGAFYGARSPEIFFKIVEKIAKSNNELFENVCIEFYGIQGRHKEVLKQYPAASGKIKIFSTVNYKESLRLMEEAHCLLSIEAPIKDSVFFPSKLVDYMGAESHIFSISPNGAAVNILKNVGATVANIYDINDVYEKLKMILCKRPMCLNENIHEFSHEEIKKRVMILLNSVKKQEDEYIEKI